MNDRNTTPESAPDAPADRPENGEPPASEAELTAALEAAEAKAEQHWAEFLRARAELDNLHKRSARELENAHKFALEGFIRELLPVKDSLEHGLQAARDQSEPNQVAQLIEGKELTLRMLGKVLADHGVEEVNPEGEPFDPERHEAMTAQPTLEHPPETVIMVLQKGYRLNGRLVRPARVVVAKAPEGGGDA